MDREVKLYICSLCRDFGGLAHLPLGVRHEDGLCYFPR
jgi:hypothetical protein